MFNTNKLMNTPLETFLHSTALVPPSTFVRYAGAALANLSPKLDLSDTEQTAS
jgi:hypothetical protein